jgi:isopentenyl-diphosphate delta-isomerase
MREDVSAHPTVSFDSDPLILVDAQDREIGSLNKAQCHEGRGVLHRAFSLFVFNSEGALLLQRRSRQKRLWPAFWSNSCCSHPRRGENTATAAKRRLEEELGLVCELRYIYKFQYHAEYLSIGSENELCWVFAGFAGDQTIRPNVNEVDDCRYVEPEVLDREMAVRPASFTPWFHMEWKSLRHDYWSILTERIAGPARAAEVPGP